MKPLQRRLRLMVVAVGLLAVTQTAEAGRSEELEPSDDIFSWVEAPDPYRLALRAALLGQHEYRKCQLVAIPSFEREWAVYLMREEGHAPQLVARRLRKHLWTQMMDVISDGGKKTSYSVGPKGRIRPSGVSRAL